jgi:4,5-DOPA dioxygenase extradiol
MKMKRRHFLGSLGGVIMSSLVLKNLNSSSSSKMTSESSTRMPTLFFGHGTPMNAISKNVFTQFLNRKGQELTKPKAILAISAHWETMGTKVLRRERPETIHDFGGFPPELFAVQYPAPGSLEVADRVQDLMKAHEVEASSDWGLDHGTWSVLTHLYPKADIPVLQLSLNRNLKMQDHLRIAQDLKALRDQGVLIIGSGNITHNLRQVDWSPNAKPMDWAVEFDQMIKEALIQRDPSALTAQDPKKHSLWKQALPSLEHYLPLLYILGASDPQDQLSFPHEEMQMGSLSMRAVEFRVVA